jgi:hypothetical protein
MFSFHPLIAPSRLRSIKLKKETINFGSLFKFEYEPDGDSACMVKIFIASENLIRMHGFCCGIRITEYNGITVGLRRHAIQVNRQLYRNCEKRERERERERGRCGSLTKVAIGRAHGPIIHRRKVVWE